ncbi:MAG: ABC transporter substrate-binding protein [Pseudomonadota bacterium]
MSARAQGGRLRIGLSEALPDFTTGAQNARSIFGAVAGQGAVYDTLTEVSADGALKGELAVSWAPSSDAAVWTFALRDNVQFHDGVALTAGIVADVFMRYRATADAASILSTVSSVEALPGNRVRFALEGSNPDFPWYLSDPGLVVTRPAASRAQPPLGTGLYRFEEWGREGRILARRVTPHYKDGYAGWFDELELLAMPDEGARAQALLSGRIDVTHDLLPETLERLDRDARFDVRMVPDARYLAFECLGADAADLRASLSATISRGNLMSGAIAPLGRAAHDNPFPQGSATVLHVSSAPPLPRELSVAVAPDLGAAGARVVSVFAKQLSASGTRARLAAQPDKADILIHRLPVRPLADWAWLDWARFSGGGAELMTALGEARACLDPELRAALFAQVNVLAARTTHVVVPCYLNNTMAYTRSVAPPGRLGADLDLDGARIAERWWRV